MEGENNVFVTNHDCERHRRELMQYIDKQMLMSEKRYMSDIDDVQKWIIRLETKMDVSNRDMRKAFDNIKLYFVTVMVGIVITALIAVAT